MQTIAKLREQIDNVDERIIKLLGERFLLLRQIGEQKKMEEKSIIDVDREISIVERMQKIGGEQGVPNSVIRSVWNAIFAESRKEQKK